MRLGITPDLRATRPQLCRSKPSVPRQTRLAVVQAAARRDQAKTALPSALLHAPLALLCPAGSGTAGGPDPGRAYGLQELQRLPA